MKATVKLQKVEKINEGILYQWYRTINSESGEGDSTKSSSYYGDDIINLSSFTEEELNNMPIIHGKKYSDEKVLSEEVYEYTMDNWESKLESEGWNEDIENCIREALPIEFFKK